VGAAVGYIPVNRRADPHGSALTCNLVAGALTAPSSIRVRTRRSCWCRRYAYAAAYARALSIGLRPELDTTFNIFGLS
jgi:hypothetical protein